MKILSSLLHSTALREASLKESSSKDTPENTVQDLFDAKPESKFVRTPSPTLLLTDGLCTNDFAVLSELTQVNKSMHLGQREKDAGYQVVYLSKEQRAEYQLFTHHEQLFRKDGITPLDTNKFNGGHKFLYVISRHGKLYAGKGARHVVHHSSFLAGKDVMAAGKLATVDGKVVFLCNHSGHYRPKAQHLLQAVRYFHDLGVLSPDALIDLRHVGVFNLKEGLEVLKQVALGEKFINTPQAS